ncbi:MAG TPA: glycerate kinase [Geminicoccaceae bacterium]|nr:glycerate kinase [Geminicoccaceae bacterium]
MGSPQRMVRSEVVLRELLEAAVAAAQPAQAMAPHLPAAPSRRTIVLGAGKAAAAMAQVVERHMPGALEGLVVTRYGHAVPCARVEVVEAAHPVPDAAGERAARRILELAAGAGPDDLVLCLISGGASALLALPAPGLSLDDKQAVNRALLASGADIGQMNAVRKHLSAIKGGRLAAAAHPARVVSLLISDVPGDEPAVIGSGPTVPDPSTFEDALAILERYRIEPPANVLAHLRAAADETPKPGDPRLARAATVVVARPQASLEAAARLARARGLNPLILSDAIEGEAREVAKVMAGIALQARRHGQPAAPPCVLLSGGETTVTVRGRGRGGRNAEFLLALAVQLRGAPGISALAADTDGIDGSEDNAGALLAPDTLARAEAKGLDARAMLADNDGYGFFSALGDLVVTGPTLTNVNDFRAILVDPA